METPSFIVHNGRKYRLQTSGKYYQDQNRHGLGAKERLLHRVIWIEHHGDIPENMCVHHKDGNWRNNAIENLALMPISKHALLHWKERYADPEGRAKMDAGLVKAREAAKAWHSSPEGLAWHKEHAKTSILNKKFITKNCEFCGKEFKSKSPGKICSNACWQKQYRQKNRILKNCFCCGAEFDCFRFDKTETCSPSCRTKMSWERRKGLQPNP